MKAKSPISPKERQVGICAESKGDGNRGAFDEEALIPKKSKPHPEEIQTQKPARVHLMDSNAACIMTPSDPAHAPTFDIFTEMLKGYLIHLHCKGCGQAAMIFPSCFLYDFACWKQACLGGSANEEHLRS